MKKMIKKKEENEKCKGKRLTKAEDFYFFVLLFTFRKPLKLFRGLPKWKFLKAKITQGKNQEK